MIAESDDDIAHQLHPLVPLAAKVFPFLVARGLGAHHALAVKGPKVRLLPRHVHPAHMVGVAFPTPGRVLVMQPLGHDAAGRPFVGGALGVAPQPNGLAVDENAPVRIVIHLAEARFDDFFVHRFPIRLQLDENPVQRRIGGRPEAKALRPA